MKRMLVNFGAIASIGLGASLIALPAFAGRQCVGGGYELPEIVDTCSMSITRQGENNTVYTATGENTGRQAPKGKYCADGGEGDCTTLADVSRPVQTYKGKCWVEFYVKNVRHRGNPIVIQNDDGSVAPYSFTEVGAWQDSEEEIMVGNCRGTATVDTTPRNREFASPDEQAYPNDQTSFGSSAPTF